MLTLGIFACLAKTLGLGGRQAPRKPDYRCVECFAFERHWQTAVPALARKIAMKALVEIASEFGSAFLPFLNLKPAF